MFRLGLLMRVHSIKSVSTAFVLSFFVSTSVVAQVPGEQSEGWFTLPGVPQASIVLANVASPAYYRVCLSGELGPSLRIEVFSSKGSTSYLLQNSCTDLLVTDQLKVTFAPGSLITNVRGKYELLGFRQALQYRSLPNP